MKWLLGIIVVLVVAFFALVPPMLDRYSTDPLTHPVRSAFDRIYIIGGDVQTAAARAKFPSKPESDLQDVKIEYENASAKLAKLIGVAKNGLEMNSIDAEALLPALAKFRADADTLLLHLQDKALKEAGVGEALSLLADEIKLVIHKTFEGYQNLHASDEERRKKAMEQLDEMKWPNWVDIHPGLF
jgi:hypothetical protein